MVVGALARSSFSLVLAVVARSILAASSATAAAAAPAIVRAIQQIAIPIPTAAATVMRAARSIPGASVVALSTPSGVPRERCRVSGRRSVVEVGLVVRIPAILGGRSAMLRGDAVTRAEARTPIVATAAGAEALEVSLLLGTIWRGREKEDRERTKKQ